MMPLANRARMIPRYNWHYGFIDLCKSLVGALQAPRRQPLTPGGLFGEHLYFTTSGRASLYTILSSLKLAKGSAIGVPLFCCPVVFDAVVEAGLTPKFIDISNDTYTLSPRDLELKRKDLGAVIAVHLFGHPVDMDAITSAVPGIPVIEDCAHSLFATYKGRLAGSMGTASFFSFRSGKYLSAGEGSLIVCATKEVADAVGTMIASFPKWRPAQSAFHSVATFIKSSLYHRPWYGTVGYPIGVRLDKKFNLTAKSGFTLRQIAPGDLSIIDERLSYFDKYIWNQRDNARYYLSAIRHKDVLLPYEKEGCKSSYFQFAIRMKDKSQRDRLSEHLKSDGIDAASYLDGIDTEARNHYGYGGDCPVSEQCSQSVLTIPVYYSLSQNDITRIVDSVNNFSG
jgi:perosamine synthetase